MIDICEEALSCPSLFFTVQVYRPLSSDVAGLIISVPSPSMVILSSATTAWPSLLQVTRGLGTPLAGHVMLMVVLGRAVMLSPTVPNTGLPSPTGIFLALSGFLISGEVGSVLTNS